MSLIVQKFGGTSVADLQRIKKVGQIILKEKNAGHKLVVVVSAMAGVTNSLISKCSEVSDLNSFNHLQEYDAVVGSGEILTAGLLALELQSLGLNAKSLQGWQVPILTDDTPGHANVMSINSDLIHKLINDDIIPVITGFQGVTKDNQITTLGKGGSDTTAALVGAAIVADRVDIYTDVLGAYSADPRIVHDAKKIDQISDEMMLMLSSYGAKVLHPRAALAAFRYKFEMRILSSFENVKGTIITSKYLKNEINMEKRIITAITSNKNLLQIDITIVDACYLEVIKECADSKLIVEKLENNSLGHINLIANLADQNKFELMLQNLKNSRKILNFNVVSNIATVTMVGYGIKNDSGFCFKVMNFLNQNNIDVQSFDVTETRFTCFIADTDTEKAIKLLHGEYLV